MKFKTEIEIRQLEAKELSAYTFDFIKHFAVENPNLSRLAEKVSTEPRLVSSVKTSLISEHNSRKIWEGEVLKEIEDGRKRAKKNKHVDRNGCIPRG